MRRPLCVFLFLTQYGAIQAQCSDATVPVRIDGANYVLYNQEYPYRSRNMFSIVRGNPLDSFPFQHISAYGFGATYDNIVSNSPALAASGRLAAEVGEPLLNRFIDDPGYNRDHATIFGSSCRLTSIPVLVYFGYRYLDTYSDKFDEIWKKFERSKGMPMKYDDEGLVKNFIGGYAFAGSRIEARGNMEKYGSWGTTPIYYSPLYQSGYKTRHDIRLARGSRSLFASAGFYFHQDYFDHMEPEHFNDLTFNAGLQLPLNRLIKARAACDINTARIPSTKFDFSIDDSLSTLLVWKAAGGVFNDLHPFAGLQLSLRPVRILTAFAEAAWDYVPRERSYEFNEYHTTVSYEPISHETVTLHLSLTYADTFFFPLTIAAWYDYYEHPIWERIRFEGDVPIITQDTLGNAAPWHIGGRVRYLISWRKLTANLWGNISITPEKAVRRFSLPYFFGADAGYGLDGGDLLFSGIRIEYRPEIILRYHNDETKTIESMATPAHMAISAILRMPFILPFARDHLGSSVCIEAGPVHLSKQFFDKPDMINLRLKEHPSGNLIGPAVAVRFDAVIR